MTMSSWPNVSTACWTSSPPCWWSETSAKFADGHPTGLLDQRDGVVGRAPGALTPYRTAEVVHHHLGALPRQLHRVAAADAVPGSRDDGDLAVEQSHPLTYLRERSVSGKRSSSTYCLPLLAADAGGMCERSPWCTASSRPSPRQISRRFPGRGPADDSGRRRAGRPAVARRRGPRRRRHPLLVQPARRTHRRSSARVRRRRGCSPVTGPRSGRRTARAGSSPRSGSIGGWRARADQQPLQGGRGRTRAQHVRGAIPVHRHRLPRHRLRRRAEEQAVRRRSRKSSCSPGRIVPARRASPPSWPAPIRRRPLEVEVDGRTALTRMTCRTSSSPRAPRERPRVRCSATAPACGRTRPGPTSSGCARRPLPHRVPALPHRGAQVGCAGVLLDRHDHRPASGVRRAVGHARHARGARHHASRTARHLPDHPQRRPRRTTTPVRCASRSPVPRPCRSSWSTACEAAQVRLGRHRLRAHRNHRHRDACAGTTTIPRSSRTTCGRAIPGVEMKIVDAAANSFRPGEPGEIAGARLPGDDRILRQPGRDRRDHRRRRLAAHRRRGVRRRGRQRDHHRPHQGHVHRRRLQRLPGRRSRT